MSKPLITTEREAIRALGGRAKVAAWLNVSISAVSNWIAYGHIARGKELHILLSLRARGYEVSPKLFGASSWDELTMPVPKSEQPRLRRAKGRSARTSMPHAQDLHCEG